MADQSESRPGAQPFIGLYTNDNPLHSPPGAMSEADNVIANNKGEYSPRPGFGRYGTSLTSTLPARRFFEYDGNLHVLTQDGANCELWYETQTNNSYDWDAGGKINENLPTTSAFSKVPGSIEAKTDRTGNNYRRPQLTELNDILYINSANGLYRKYPANSAGTLEPAFNPVVDFLTLEITGDGDPNTSGELWWYETNSTIQTVAYRIVTKQKIEDTEFVSAPSSRVVLISDLLPDGNEFFWSAGTGSTTTITARFASDPGLAVGEYFTITDDTAGFLGTWEVTGLGTLSQDVEFEFGSALSAGSNSDGFDWRKNRQVNVTLSEPKDITYPTTFEIYRTNITSVIQNVGITDPGDEVFRAVTQSQDGTGSAEGTNWTYDGANNEYTFKDTVAELNLGAALYTNPSQTGIQNANNNPPASFTMAQFQEHLFYGNTNQPARGEVILKDLVETGDVTVTINDGVTDYDFTINSASGTTIEEQTLEFVREINRNQSINIQAAYTSTFEGDPGRFVLKHTTDLDSNITISADSGEFEPAIQTTTETIKPEVKKNRIYYSKLQEFTATPLLNFLDVDEEAEILHFQVMNTRMYVFTDRGVYELSGVEPPWSLRLVDPTIQLVAPDSVLPLEGYIYGVSTQGVFRMSGSGKDIVSRPWEDILFTRMAYQNFFYEVHASKDEIEHEYVLYLPKSEEANSEMEGFRFNTQTRAWTKILRDFKGSYMRPSDQTIYTGLSQSDGQTGIMKMRRSGTSVDAQDEYLDITVDSISGNTATVTFSDPWVEPSLGDAIEKDSELRWLESVTPTTGNEYEVVLDNVPEDWTTTGTGKLSKAILSRVRFTPFTFGAIPLDKRWNETKFMIRNANTSKFTIGYETEKNTDLKVNTLNTIENTLTGTTSSSTWGANGWGDQAWSGTTPFSYYSFRDFVPKERAVSQILFLTLEHNRAKESYALVDLTVLGDQITYKTSK